MRTYTPILCLSILLIIASCSSYRYFDIQILNPGSVKLPEKKLKLIIVDPEKTGNISRDSVAKDSKHMPLYKIAIHNFNSSLKDQLEQSPIFQDSSIKIPGNLSLLRDNFDDNIKRISYIDCLKKLYASEDVAVMIVKYKFKILIVELPIFSPYGSYILYSKFQIELSNLKTNEVYDWHQILDSYTGSARSLRNLDSEAIKDVSGSLAKSYARRIAPHWTTEEREILYSPNKMMRKAYDYFCDNDLDHAVQSWKQLYNIGTRKLSSYAAYNIALVYELQDDLNSSEDWLIKSIQKKVNRSSRKYLDIIRERKLLRISLDTQL